MRNLLVRWLIGALVILMIPHLISGVQVDGLGAALAASAVLTLLNFLVKPLLILFTLPLTVLTMGLFLLVVNALVFNLVPYFVTGMRIDAFSSAFLASLIVSFTTWLLHLSIEVKNGRRKIIVRQWQSRGHSDSNVIDV